VMEGRSIYLYMYLLSMRFVFIHIIEQAKNGLEGRNERREGRQERKKA
jgi:hypothetical protein